MQNQALFTIFVGGAAGICGALATSLFVIPSEAETTSPVVSIPEPTVVASGISKDELEHELDGLRATNNALSQRVEELEQARVWARDRRQVVEASQVAPSDTREDQMKKAMASLANPDGSMAPELAEGVRKAFENFREEEREESEQRREEARLAELAIRIERYTTDLGLDDYQSKELGALLTNEQERRDEMMTEARENGSFMNLRDEMRTLRDETRDGLELVLTPDQLEKYEDTSRGGRGGGGRGRRE
ncbi:MAG: hypothetical protein ACI87A_002829 [Planctomycetota bacterium]|jgi:hypothetical protein